ncbi:hypothetical protein DL765_006059 [Monosporascus sp. GIB2]|nr:hypothetical protein DL765_006059 [Monosporascus sp. GIB2]
MAVPPKGAAAYKKKDGTLSITPDYKAVTWTAASDPGGTPAISLTVANIANLQQTPDSSPKVMLKIFEKPAAGGDPVAYTFHFNSASDPRAEANEIKDVLSRLIAGARSSDPAVPRPAAASGSGSAAMAFASTASAKPATARLFDDEKLKTDIALQQSLMKADRNLLQMYMEARATKPENMSDATFNTQFWAARVNLLRAHAIETSQKKGPYNVLAQVKPTLEQGTDPDQPSRMKLSITVEQVQMIMNQHPLVKRIYNENVPPLTEGEFWERFFLSKLSKKLRGERTTGLENPDKVFDKYDEYEDIAAFSTKHLSQHIPHIIDVEANEENQGGFRGGNRKDVEMRPRGRADVPIIQTLNSISEKILANITPVDSAHTDQTGADYDTYKEVALRDLRGDVEEQRIMLNIKEQSKFFNQNAAASEANETYARQKPDQVLRVVQGDLATLGGDGAEGIDLHASLGIDDESDSEDEREHHPHVGSRASRKDAQKQILDSMLQRRAQLFGHSSDETSPMGLPSDLTAKCNLTHATTIEFLHQFWSAFLSGDPDRAAELGYLVDSLRRSKERINAVAAEAEKVREAEIRRKKEEIIQIYERTKKKVKFNSKSIRGGKDAVLKLMDPVLQSLDKAIADYQRALAAEGLQASTE